MGTSYQNEKTPSAEMLYETITLRAESIEGQLNGTIPSTDEGQRQDSSSLIDASHINVKAMGQFSMGGFGGGFGGKSDDSEGSDDSGESGDSQKPGGFSFGDMPEGFSPEDMPEDFDPENVPEGSDSGNRPDVGSFSFGSRPSSNGFGPGSFKPGDSTEALNQKRLKTLTTYGICLALALAGLGAATAIKRKK